LKADRRDAMLRARTPMAIASTRRKLAPLLLFAPFLLISVLFACADVLAMRHVSKLGVETEGVVHDMVTDIELISQMRRDLDHVRLLADQHVVEKEAVGMAGLDASLASSEGDFAGAAAKYESLPMLRGEQGPWQELTAELAAIKPRLEGVLEASRRNDDSVALGRLVALQGDFDRADDNLRSLLEFNRRSADDAVARIGALQTSGAASMQLLAIAGMGLSLTVGIAMIRVLERRAARLRQYAAMLESSNRDLDAFAGRVAHDLRSPLSTAALATSRLSRQSPSPEQIKTFDIIHRSFGRMTAIIEDLLAISRIEASEPVASDPAAAAEQVREELAPRVEGSDVSLLIDVQPARVRCSEGLLRQVMWNLADNAMKYRRPEVRSRVEICGRAAAGSYELSVGDNGVGIAPDETGKVFAPFYRGAAGRGPPGTGLGLSIVRRAVEANGGTVSVTSVCGRGSTFVARLPLA
jgi:nitrogen-specific signal transduction histidine kinase